MIKNLKILPIRRWLIIALVIYLFCAMLPFQLIERAVCEGQTHASELATAREVLAADAPRWNDPTWQRSISAKLPVGLTVVLREAGHEIFRTGEDPIKTIPDWQIVALDGTREIGIADLYNASACSSRTFLFFGLPTSLLAQAVIMLMIGWILARYVMNPLAAMSQAARQIASGDLDFQIPPSRVREVAEVSAAFHAMGDALRSSLTRQAELEQDRRFFISAIAHDLRTPLFALRGYLEGLERGIATTPEKVTHYIEVCQEKADALERLIADLFDYSRLEYLEQPPRRDPIDFGKLVEKTVDDIRIQAATKHIALQLDGAACSVNADWSLLTRALGNLLDNALRYTPVGGSIWVTWHKQSHLVQFTITDSGPGIASTDLPHLFTPLYRAETSRNRQTGGAGLGLSIARRILRAHGGDLVATNCIQGGAEFTGSFEAMDYE